MTYKTHTTFAIALSFSPVFLPGELDFISSSQPALLPFIFTLVFFFSLAPDFDEPNSYLSKRYPWKIISIILSSLFSHRGATHWFIASLFPAIITTSVLLYFHKINEFWILIYFSWIAYVSHSLGDGFTVSGVRKYFYPLSNKTLYSLPKFLRFKTGSFTESLWFLFFSLIIFLEMYLFFSKNQNLNKIIENFSSII